MNESRPQEGESNLHQWKTKAILMTHEIKQKGMIAGRRELCRVAKEEYSWKQLGQQVQEIRSKFRRY